MSQPRTTPATDAVSALLDALDGGADVRIGRRPLDGRVSGYDADADLVVLDPAASREQQAEGLADALAALVAFDDVPQPPSLRLLRG